MLTNLITLKKQADLKEDVELQPHQEAAVEHARDQSGTIVNHGLGSGKTVTSLAIAEDKDADNVLALTPASLRENYKEEIEEFLPEERHDDYHVESYTKFRRDPDEVMEEAGDPDHVVADEIHRLRNPTQARKALEERRDQFDSMTGLTGTLINNHPTEVSPLTNLVADDKVIGGEEIKRDHIETEKEEPGWVGWFKGVEPGEREKVKNKDTLRDKLSPYIHRFSGDETYEQYVPDVDEQVVEVPLSETQEDKIKGLQKESPAAAYKLKHNLPPSKEDASELNAFMTGARQVANTPAVMDENIDNDVEASPKFQQMVEDVNEARDEYDRFKGVHFSNYLDAGVEPVNEAMNEDGEAYTYQGGMTDSQKREVIEAYNEGDADMLGLSPAGSEGLDLKGTRLLQTTEPDWNPETLNQAIGRAARYKSHTHLPEDEQHVQVNRYRTKVPDRWYHKLPGVTKPTSPDQYIASRAREKEELTDGFYDALPDYAN